MIPMQDLRMNKPSTSTEGFLRVVGPNMQASAFSHDKDHGLYTIFLITLQTGLLAEDCTFL